MDLPQELLDEILDYLPSDGRQGRRSLRNYSLVAKSWVNPSQRRLFKTVEIWERDLQSWLDSIPPANEWLLQHIHSLSYIADAGARRNSFPAPGYRIDVLRDYLPSFQQLRHLSLSSMHLPSDIPHRVEIFSAFRHTLLRLSFYYCRTTFAALVALINYFPNVNRLDLGRPLYSMDDQPAAPLSRPLIPKLHISDCYEDGLDLLDQLSGHGLVLDEVVVSYVSQHHLHTLGPRIVDVLGANIKCLRVLPSLAGYRSGYGGSTISLSHCRELQELELPAVYPGTKEANILSSIASTNIQKVTFTHRPSLWDCMGSEADWKIFDDPLCQLVDRSECGRELEVDFRFVDVRVMQEDGETKAARIVDSLAEFREKGRIRVVCVGLDGDERVDYSSNGVM